MVAWSKFAGRDKLLSSGLNKKVLKTVLINRLTYGGVYLSPASVSTVGGVWFHWINVWSPNIDAADLFDSEVAHVAVSENIAEGDPFDTVIEWVTRDDNGSVGGASSGWSTPGGDLKLFLKSISTAWKNTQLKLKLPGGWGHFFVTA